MEILCPVRLLRGGQSPEEPMLDILLPGLGAGIFVLLAAYAAVCDRV